tara:strand:+ start:23 stop:1051 length:1029 start_codon:yes stop_codon:yes gene_type:complete
MNPANYIKINVPGDGGCFFHSVAWLYKLNQLLSRAQRTNKKQIVSDISHKDIIKLSKTYRDLAIAWMKDNLDTWHHEIGLSLRQFIEIEILEDDNIDSVNDYIEKMKGITEYAGGSEVTAMGNVLETSIAIYTLNGNELQPVPNAKYTHPGSEDLMEIYHNTGSSSDPGSYHYEPLFRKTNLLDFGNIENLFQTYVKKKTKKDIKSHLHLNKVINFGGKEKDQTRQYRYKINSDKTFKDLRKILMEQMINPEKDIILYNGSPLTEEYNNFKLKDLGLTTGEGNESEWINDSISLLIDGTLFSGSRNKKKKTKRRGRGKTKVKSKARGKTKKKKKKKRGIRKN